MLVNNKLRDKLLKLNYKIPKDEDEMSEVVEDLQDYLINKCVDEEGELTKEGEQIDELIDELIDLMED